MFSLGRMFGSLAAGESDPIMRDPLTQKELWGLSEKAWESFCRTWPDAISIYPPKDLMDLLALQTQEDGFYNVDALNESIQFGDRTATTRILADTLAFAFYVLYQNPRSGLRRLQIVEEIPAEAKQQLEWLIQKFAKPEAEPEPEPVAVVVPAAPVDPAEQCVSDWKALGSSAFKAKWMTNNNNRPVFDAVVAAGRL